MKCGEKNENYDVVQNNTKTQASGQNMFRLGFEREDKRDWGEWWEKQRKQWNKNKQNSEWGSEGDSVKLV